jgi:diguanylate cyclase (GGDEF)-like protein/PAS domain S-box-containing protein
VIELVPGPAAVPTLLIASLIFCLGIVVVARERASQVTGSFFVLTTSVAIWLGGISMLYMSANAATAGTWARVTYFGVSLIPAAVLQFTVALVDETRQRRLLLAASWSASAIFLVLFLATDLLITGVWHYSWGYYVKLGAASLTFLLFLGMMLTTSLLVLRSALASELSDQQRLRYRSFLVALAIGYLGAVDFLPSFGVNVYPAGYIAVAAFIVLAVRAIRRFRLLDLSPSFFAENLLDTMHGGVIVVDTRGRVRVANGVAAALLGYSSREMRGHALNQLLGAKTLPATDSPTFARIGRTRNRPMTWLRRDGSTVDLSVSVTMLRDREQLPVGILYALHDLSERRRAERHEFAANHDALTGLPNRAYFASRFDDVVDEARGRGRVAALLFIDLDGFKQVNDRDGHESGDRVLQIVAARLRNALRAEDLVARHGGDEFVVLVSLRGEEDASMVARKLEGTISAPMKVETRELTVGASVGVAIAPREGATIEDTLRVADEAMYRMKGAKPKRVTLKGKQTDVAAPWSAAAPGGVVGN